MENPNGGGGAGGASEEGVENPNGGGGAGGASEEGTIGAIGGVWVSDSPSNFVVCTIPAFVDVGSFEGNSGS